MKKAWIQRRIKFAFQSFPKRLSRLLTYFYHPFYVGDKFRSLPLLLADCLFVFDIYEIMTNLYKPNVRNLTEREIELGVQIFGQSIDYQLVTMDEKAELMTKKLGVIYVSFNTINSWGKMRDDILIHELVHVWQNQHFGAGYIANALVAQRSKEGYNYAFTEGWHEEKSLLNFNAEQQGDLVQDYFRLKNGLKADWGKMRENDLDKYEKFIVEMIATTS